MNFCIKEAIPDDNGRTGAAEVLNERKIILPFHLDETGVVKPAKNLIFLSRS